MSGHIVIAGSCVAALTMKCARFPLVGETVAADVFMAETGGKGTNQALAAARLGSQVVLIGYVGQDNYAAGILKTHQEFGVDISRVRQEASGHTGVAFIIINNEGKNMIAIAPGCNYKLTQDDFDRNEDVIKPAEMIGFQLELNLDFVEYGIQRAAAWGVKTLLDPAPAQPLDESLYGSLDYIKPNETEAALLTGIEVKDKESAFKAARWFLERGVKHAIITLGENGVVLLDSRYQEHIMPPKVKAVDPTAAGDIFSGALMHGLAQGADLLEAARFAVCASARSVQTLGALSAMPTQQEVITFRQSF